MASEARGRGDSSISSIDKTYVLSVKQHGVTLLKMFNRCIPAYVVDFCGIKIPLEYTHILLDSMEMLAACSDIHQVHTNLAVATENKMIVNRQSDMRYFMVRVDISLQILHSVFLY